MSLLAKGLTSLCLLGLTLTFASAPSHASEYVLRKPVLLSPAAHSWLRAAGLVFQGTVVSVRNVVPQPKGTPAQVEITFLVADGLRGVQSGASLTIREWSGIWLGHPRYRAGEQVFAMLYQPNAAGITSEVAGSGSLPVNRLGYAAVPPAWLASTPGRSGTTYLDLATFRRAIRTALRPAQLDHAKRLP